MLQNSRSNAFSDINRSFGMGLRSTHFACMLDEYVIEPLPERQPAHVLSVLSKGVFWRREARSLEIQL